MSWGAIVAMVIGVAGTSVIHLSKGMMRHGIGSRNRAAYTVGVLMNFTNPLWVMVANRFAPTVFYTSMYGLGMVPLLIFSRVVLGERLHARQYTGIGVIIGGTILIGAGNAIGAPPSLFGANRSLLIAIAVTWAVGAPLAALLMRGRAVRVQEYLFGIAAGGMAALEAVVKGVAQSGATTSTFLPTDSAAWWLFGLSFLGAAGAFGMIQWSYIRQCRASVMGALYNVAYVTMPLIVSTLIVASSELRAWHVAGIVCLGVGVMITARSAPSHTRS